MLNFLCRTNKDYVRINTAKIKLKSGSVLTVDRDRTEYIMNNGVLYMKWYDCYLWAIDDRNIFNNNANLSYLSGSEFSKLLNGALISFELEDDADKDYEVEIISWEVME